MNIVVPPPTFASLGLSKTSLEALHLAKYEAPTLVQAQAIPPALQGRDVIGCAATGTGKTAAFVLPIVERLAGRTGTRALVVAPTRELALQIVEHATFFGRPHGLRAAEIIGGVGFEPQIRALRTNFEIIVATPGRLVDHMERGTARLGGIEILVLDEADRMLDMGFKPQLDRILAQIPRERQTMLFSATMAGEVAGFARACLKNPVRIEIIRSGTVAERAEQKAYFVPQNEKAPMLLALLSEDKESTLVFTRTRRRADRVARTVARAGHRVACIHSDRSQGQRVQALEGFRAGRVRVLVATDIAARGLDVEAIGHVVNFDIPYVPEDYVHRVGRTARMAASGRASSLVSPEEHDLLRGIEKLTRHPIARGTVPANLHLQVQEVMQAQERHFPRAPHGRPAHPAHPTRAAHPANPAHPTHPANHVQPAHPAHPARAAQGHPAPRPAHGHPTQTTPGHAARPAHGHPAPRPAEGHPAQRPAQGHAAPRPTQGHPGPRPTQGHPPRRPHGGPPRPR